MNQVTTIYEQASTDGYHNTGDGLFHLDVEAAARAAAARHGNYGRVNSHAALSAGDGRFYLLSRRAPVALVGTDGHRQELVAKAMAKLTSEEIAALGLVAK